MQMDITYVRGTLQEFCLQNFKGTIEPLGDQKFVMSGEISTLSDTKVEITELPIR